GSDVHRGHGFATERSSAAGAVGRPRVVVYYPSFAKIGGGEMQALLTALALADVYDVELCGQHLPTPARFMETFGAHESSLASCELEARGLLRHVIGDRATIRRWRHAFIRWSPARQLAHRPADLLFR